VPAVVRVIDFLEANGTAYMVMALARGETLDLRLRRDGPMPPAGVERMLFLLLDGLEQVHQAGFLHRDIKPANIIIGAEGAPTLIDFGAARATMAERTAAMTAIFTPGYAAAEQFTSAKQGPWTDIYGLSATVYHAITGSPPPSAFGRMLDDTYEPLGALPPSGFSPRVLAAIDSGLAVSSWDEEQKRIEADRKKAEDQKKLDEEKKRADDAKAKADAEAKARAGVVPQGTAETPSNRPAGRWNGNIHCKTWPPGGMRLNLSPTGGEASGARRGAAPRILRSRSLTTSIRARFGSRCRTLRRHSAHLSRGRF